MFAMCIDHTICWVKGVMPTLSILSINKLILRGRAYLCGKCLCSAFLVCVQAAFMFQVQVYLRGCGKANKYTYIQTHTFCKTISENLRK